MVAMLKRLQFYLECQIIYNSNFSTSFIAINYEYVVGYSYYSSSHDDDDVIINNNNQS